MGAFAYRQPCWIFATNMLLAPTLPVWTRSEILFLALLVTAASVTLPLYGEAQPQGNGQLSRDIQVILKKLDHLAFRSCHSHDPSHLLDRMDSDGAFGDLKYDNSNGKDTKAFRTHGRRLGSLVCHWLKGKFRSVTTPSITSSTNYLEPNSISHHSSYPQLSKDRKMSSSYPMPLSSNYFTPPPSTTSDKSSHTLSSKISLSSINYKNGILSDTSSTTGGPVLYSLAQMTSTITEGYSRPARSIVSILKTHSETSTPLPSTRPHHSHSASSSNTESFSTSFPLPSLSPEYETSSLPIPLASSSILTSSSFPTTFSVKSTSLSEPQNASPFYHSSTLASPPLSSTSSLPVSFISKSPISTSYISSSPNGSTFSFTESAEFLPSHSPSTASKIVPISFPSSFSTISNLKTSRLTTLPDLFKTVPSLTPPTPPSSLSGVSSPPSKVSFPPPPSKSSSHNHRPMAVRHSYSHPEAISSWNEEEVQQKISISYWFLATLAPENKARNWWNHLIGMPKYTWVGLYLASRNHLVHPRTISLLLDRYWTNTPEGPVWNHQSHTGRMAGGNLGNRALLGVVEAALRYTLPTTLRQVHFHLERELRDFAGWDENGPKPDGCLHQHSMKKGRHESAPRLAQIYNNNYGVEFLMDVSAIASLVQGTSMAFDNDTLEGLFYVFLGCHQWLHRGHVAEPSTTGRFIASGQKVTYASTRKGVHETCMNLLSLDGVHKGEVESVLHRFYHPIPDPDHALVGNKHFFSSDLMAHHRPTYMATLRLLSNRTSRPETYMTLNQRGYFLGDGFLTILRDGEELGARKAEVFQVYDWARIPGVTNLYTSAVPQIPTQKKWVHHAYNNASFVGGASDDYIGLASMIYNRPHSQVRARKSWMFLDDMVVCLGSHIHLLRGHITGQPVSTTLAQQVHSGRASYGFGRSYPEGVLHLGQRLLKRPTWVHHAEQGYVILEGNQRVGLKAKAKPIDRKKSISVFTLWLEHGLAPRDARYSVVLLPFASLSETSGFANNPPIRTFMDDRTHIIIHKPSKTSGVVFFSATTVTLDLEDDVLVVTVSVPCILTLRRSLSNDSSTASVPRLVSEPLTPLYADQGLSLIPLPLYHSSSVSKSASIPSPTTSSSYPSSSLSPLPSETLFPTPLGLPLEAFETSSHDKMFYNDSSTTTSTSSSRRTRTITPATSRNSTSTMQVNNTGKSSSPLDSNSISSYNHNITENIDNNDTSNRLTNALDRITGVNASEAIRAELSITTDSYSQVSSSDFSSENTSRTMTNVHVGAKSDVDVDADANADANAVVGADADADPDLDDEADPDVSTATGADVDGDLELPISTSITSQDPTNRPSIFPQPHVLRSQDSRDHGHQEGKTASRVLIPKQSEAPMQDDKILSTVGEIENKGKNIYFRKEKNKDETSSEDERIINRDYNEVFLEPFSYPIHDRNTVIIQNDDNTGSRNKENYKIFAYNSETPHLSNKDIVELKEENITSGIASSFSIDKSTSIYSSEITTINPTFTYRPSLSSTSDTIKTTVSPIPTDKSTSTYTISTTPNLSSIDRPAFISTSNTSITTPTPIPTPTGRPNPPSSASATIISTITTDNSTSTHNFDITKTSLISSETPVLINNQNSASVSTSSARQPLTTDISSANVNPVPTTNPVSYITTSIPRPYSLASFLSTSPNSHISTARHSSNTGSISLPGIASTKSLASSGSSTPTISLISIDNSTSTDSRDLLSAAFTYTLNSTSSILASNFTSTNSPTLTDSLTASISSNSTNRHTFTTSPTYGNRLTFNSRSTPTDNLTSTSRSTFTDSLTSIGSSILSDSLTSTSSTIPTGNLTPSHSSSIFTDNLTSTSSFILTDRLASVSSFISTDSINSAMKFTSADSSIFKDNIASNIISTSSDNLSPTISTTSTANLTYINITSTDNFASISDSTSADSLTSTSSSTSTDNLTSASNFISTVAVTPTSNPTSTNILTTGSMIYNDSLTSATNTISTNSLDSTSATTTTPTSIDKATSTGTPVVSPSSMSLLTSMSSLIFDNSSTSTASSTFITGSTSSSTLKPTFSFNLSSTDNSSSSISLSGENPSTNFTRTRSFTAIRSNRTSSFLPAMAPLPASSQSSTTSSTTSNVSTSDDPAFPTSTATPFSTIISVDDVSPASSNKLTSYGPTTSTEQDIFTVEQVSTVSLTPSDTLTPFDMPIFSTDNISLSVPITSTSSTSASKVTSAGSPVPTDSLSFFTSSTPLVSSNIIADSTSATSRNLPASSTTRSSLISPVLPTYIENIDSENSLTSPNSTTSTASLSPITSTTSTESLSSIGSIASVSLNSVSTFISAASNNPTTSLTSTTKTTSTTNFTSINNPIFTTSLTGAASSTSGLSSTLNANLFTSARATSVSATSAAGPDFTTNASYTITPESYLRSSSIVNLKSTKNTLMLNRYDGSGGIPTNDEQTSYPIVQEFRDPDRALQLPPLDADHSPTDGSTQREKTNRHELPNHKAHSNSSYPFSNLWVHLFSFSNKGEDSSHDGGEKTQGNKPTFRGQPGIAGESDHGARVKRKLQEDSGVLHKMLSSIDESEQSPNSRPNTFDAYKNSATWISPFSSLYQSDYSAPDTHSTSSSHLKHKSLRYLNPSEADRNSIMPYSNMEVSQSSVPAAESPFLPSLISPPSSQRTITPSPEHSQLQRITPPKIEKSTQSSVIHAPVSIASKSSRFATIFHLPSSDIPPNLTSPPHSFYDNALFPLAPSVYSVPPLPSNLIPPSDPPSPPSSLNPPHRSPSPSPPTPPPLPNPTTYVVAVSDPGGEARAVHIEVRGTRARARTVLALPEGHHRGKSVKVLIQL